MDSGIDADYPDRRGPHVHDARSRQQRQCRQHFLDRRERVFYTSCRKNRILEEEKSLTIVHEKYGTRVRPKTARTKPDSPNTRRKFINAVT